MRGLFLFVGMCLYFVYVCFICCMVFCMLCMVCSHFVDGFRHVLYGCVSVCSWVSVFCVWLVVTVCMVFCMCCMCVYWLPGFLYFVYGCVSYVFEWFSVFVYGLLFVL